MPAIPFASLPDNARAWVFASDRPLTRDEATIFLAEVDRFLAGWAAHGAPLTCGRDWRDEQFLVVAVDQSTAGASGCSIDGLFRAFSALQPQIGASLLTTGRVFYRDESGTVHCVTRGEFTAQAAAGAIGRETIVFDTSVVTAGAWRTQFETRVDRSWHASLVHEPAR